MASIVVRCLILLLLLLITFGAQLMSLSSYINNRVDANQDKLKNVINYFATVNGALLSVSLYFLGSLFTRDIAWHLNERPGSKRFNRAWGFSPQLPAIIDGVKIGGKRWIVIGAAMSLIAIFALVKTVWFSLSIKIIPHVTYSNPLNVTISSIHNGFSNEDGDGPQLNRKGVLGVFASSVIMGLKDKTILHSDNGEYIWSPWLIDPKVTEVTFTNYTTVGFRPNCTLLKPSQVKATYNVGTSDVAFDFEPSLYNTSTVKSVPTLHLTADRKQSTWSSTAVQYISDNPTPRNYSVIFHAFTMRTNNSNKTFSYNSSKILGYDRAPFLAYIYGCRIDINTYNISGHLTSETGTTLDRLQLTNKALMSAIPEDPDDSEILGDPNNPIYNGSLDRGQLLQKVDLSVTAFADVIAAIKSDGIETCVPIQCWMYDEIPGVYTDYNSKTDGIATAKAVTNGWQYMTRELVEYKTAQAIGYMISPSLLGMTDNMTALNITHDYVLETNPGYIFGGVAIQLFLILLVVVMYIASVSDINRYHADDLDYLVALVENEAPNELHDMKTEEEDHPLHQQPFNKI